VEPDASNFMVKIIRIYMGVNTETGAVSELNEPLSVKGTFVPVHLNEKKSNKYRRNEMHK